MSNDSQACWVFSFCLESESGEPVSRAEATELMENIIRYVEENNLQIGGGFRAPRADELEPGPIFDVEGDDHL